MVKVLWFVTAMEDSSISHQTIVENITIVLTGLAILVGVGVFFSPILWWAACISITLGLLLELWYMYIALYVHFTFRPPDDGIEVEDEGSVFIFLIHALAVLLIVPAACILLVLWFFNLAPEAFSFLGSPSNPLTLPSYYSVGRSVTWITITILCAGPIWATVAAIAALRRRIGKHSVR
jgi:hypothetical protein